MRIAGVDEVGRGSLFGPVFAGAVILNNKAAADLLKLGLKDSKLLSAKKRSALIPEIKSLSSGWALGQASSNEIDKFGIRLATEKAMIRALLKLPFPIEMVLVDGVLPIRNWKGFQKTLVRGESQSLAIAAASVLAKEARDKLIRSLSNKYPGYSLDKNVGYGTKDHRLALIKQGPTKLHRYSFLSKILVNRNCANQGKDFS